MIAYILLFATIIGVVIALKNQKDDFNEKMAEVYDYVDALTDETAKEIQRSQKLNKIVYDYVREGDKGKVKRDRQGTDKAPARTGKNNRKKG